MEVGYYSCCVSIKHVDNERVVEFVFSSLDTSCSVACHNSPETMEVSFCDDRDQTLGLLFHYLFSNGSAQCVFLDLDDAQSLTANQYSDFRTEANCHICASCNGMLLLSTLRENVLYYHIFNPVSNQSVFLPPPQIPKRSIRTGLAFDGAHYQVIRIFSIKNEQVHTIESSSAKAIDILEMEIFSSATGMWRRYFSMICLPPELPIMTTNPLFWNGAIHWELGGHLLTYFTTHFKCMLIKLPNYSRDQTLTYGQCLWASRGHLHYCYSDFRGIHIWILIKERGENDFLSFFQNLDSLNMRWELSYSIRHDTLMTLNPAIFLRLRQREEFSCWKPSFVSPCAYVEHLDSLYLRLPGFIVSYDFRAHTLKEVCTYAFPSTNFNCCRVFPLLKKNSSMGNGKTPAGNGGILSLPVVNALVKRCESH